MVTKNRSLLLELWDYQKQLDEIKQNPGPWSLMQLYILRQLLPITHPVYPSDLYK